ncbi:MAG: hypothetical protein R3190_06060, partial [Thermoanaerobaculia bacterium]|nr:hypothetical protein [Thermoanaerobaculia bacterium]
LYIRRLDGEGTGTQLWPRPGDWFGVAPEGSAFLIAQGGAIYRLPLDLTGPTARVGSAETLFELGESETLLSFDARYGEPRILLNTLSDTATLHFVQNWFVELEALFGGT